MTYNLRCYGKQRVADTLKFCAENGTEECQWLARHATASKPEQTLQNHYQPSSSKTQACATLLATGGVIGALFTLCKDTAYKTVFHGVKWFSWSAFNQATVVPKENNNLFTWYVNTYTQLREQGEQGYFEGYRNVTLALAALLGTAVAIKYLYNKYMK